MLAKHSSNTVYYITFVIMKTIYLVTAPSHSWLAAPVGPGGILVVSAK